MQTFNHIDVWPLVPMISIPMTLLVFPFAPPAAQEYTGSDRIQQEAV